MKGAPLSFGRFASSAWLVTAMLLLASCVQSQLTQLPPWLQGPKDGSPAQAAPKPPADAQSVPQVAKPPLAARQQMPRVAGAAAAPPPGAATRRSLRSLLSRPGGAPELASRGAAPGEDRFAQPPPPPLDPGVPRVALLLPLSGPNAKVGQSLFNAAQMALFDFADDKFELLIHDTRGTPEGAADAAALAVGDGAALILGPLFSASVQAAAPQARAAGINVIAFSNDRAVAGDGVYVMGFAPEEEIDRVIRFARAKGLIRFAALAPDNAYGAAVVNELRRSTEAVGALLTRIEYYDPAISDFSAIIRRLANYDRRRSTLLAQRAELESRPDDLARAALQRLKRVETIGGVPFEALLIAEGGTRLQAIAALLPYFDIDPKKIRMLGTGQWDVPGLGAEPAMVGGWFAAPPPETRRQFEAQYKSAYGVGPHRLATLAYDATALAAVLAQADSARKFTAGEITSPRGYAGRDGIFRFLPQGMVERGLSVLQIGERDIGVVSQAPENFAGGDG